MDWLDLSLPTPAENLALDEALLLEVEGGEAGSVLRFWTLALHFVVVGIGNRVAREVDVAACEARGIPILRRCTGGGTVLQGVGCLNYSLVLAMEDDEALSGIRQTNEFILQRNAAALSGLLGREVMMAGHTDLVLDGRKISGNAQRRLRRHVLFHGTFLLHFDLELLTEVLPLPSLQPEYRQNRAHVGFLQNLDLSGETVKTALRSVWTAEQQRVTYPQAAVRRLVEERYSRREWNLRI